MYMDIHTCIYVVISVLGLAGMEFCFFFFLKVHCHGILHESFTDQKAIVRNSLSLF